MVSFLPTNQTREFSSIGWRVSRLVSDDWGSSLGVGEVGMLSGSSSEFGMDSTCISISSCGGLLIGCVFPLGVSL